MAITSWPTPAQTGLTVQVTTDGLPGVYDATVRLGRAELFHDGWQPMLDAAAMSTLLADLAGLGDEPTQLAILGWTLRPAADGQVELVEANLTPEPLDQIDGRFRLPRECGFTVAGDLPPLAQLYRSLTLLEAYAYGRTEQHVEPADLLGQARSAARALGDILGALLGLAVDTDAETVHTVLTEAHNQISASEHPAAAPQPDTDDKLDDDASVRVICQELVSAAADMVLANLPTTPQ